MDRSEFAHQYLGSFTATERDRVLYEMAEHYHHECEAYDRTVCTGVVGSMGILPRTTREFSLINQHALRVMRRLIRDAEAQGIARDVLHRAIVNHRRSR